MNIPFCFDTVNFIAYLKLSNKCRLNDTFILYIAKTPSKGKENKDVKDRKRVFKDDDDDDKEKKEEEQSEPIQPKKRRLIIPDEESGEDSGDEFKPGLFLNT